MPDDAGGAQLASGSRQPDAVQRTVTSWYEAHAEDWRTIYADTSTGGRIRRRRLARTLAWVDGLCLRAGSRALDLGAGGGTLATALADRGLHVVAVDRAAAMLRVTHEQTAAVDLVLGDGHALGVASSSCDLALSLGVIPLLHSPAEALSELRRVLRPGGWLIISGQNRLGLRDLLDPRFNPVVRLPRRAVRHWLEAGGVMARDEGVRLFDPTLGEFEHLLAGCGLEVLRNCSLGFGPLTLLGRPLLPESAMSSLDEQLQAAADRGVPLLAQAGIEYLVLARKPGCVP